MRSTVLVGLLGLALSITSTTAAPSPVDVQLPLSGPSSLKSSDAPVSKASKKRPLKGRFLHITDIHPDPHYKAGATFESGCHKRPKKKGKKGKKGGKGGKGEKGKGKGKGQENDSDSDEDDSDDSDGEGDDDASAEMFKGDKDLAGKWGTAVSDCDTPMSLVNITFDWLKQEWADEIDFVVWTGDNARHDIDRSLPRTPKEIFSLNRLMVDKMTETFGRDIPIVPSIGNNDIYPHNVLAAGPSKITEEFLLIWKHFIPSDAAHVFERGAYFSQEVIPDRLAVISLNTLFWYDSNTLVDGCGHNSGDPGALEMDWLEVQLNNFRQRGMQVWMTGHVPPHMGHYYDNCYLRYGDLALRYQDTIVGHLFGHMNVDHFFFIDVDELEATTDLRIASNITVTSSPFPDALPAEETLRHGPHLANSGRYRVAGRSGAQTLEEELKKDFGEMPGPRVLKMKDYTVMNVAPSVIPTYFPGIRVFAYNITGLNDNLQEDVFYRGGEQSVDDEDDDLEEYELDTEDWGSIAGSYQDPREVHDIEIAKERRGGHRHDKPKDDCSLPENEDKPHCVFPRKPRHFSKHSPSRTNRALSPLGYTQFYLPKVDKQGKRPEWEVEYTTFKVRHLLPPPSPNATDPRPQPLPVPLHLLPGYDPSIFAPSPPDDKSGKKEVAKRKEKFHKALKKITPYRMKDLTIGSWVKLAKMLVLEKKRWKKFSELMLVSTEAAD